MLSKHDAMAMRKGSGRLGPRGELFRPLYDGGGTVKGGGGGECGMED